MTDASMVEEGGGATTAGAVHSMAAGLDVVLGEVPPPPTITAFGVAEGVRDSVRTGLEDGLDAELPTELPSIWRCTGT